MLRLDNICLKVFVEVIPDRGRPELDRIQQPLLTHVDEGLCKVHKVLEVSQFKRCRIGWGLKQEGSNQACLTAGIGFVALVGIGITLRMPRDLTILARIVAVVAEVITVLHEGGAATKRHNLQTVTRQLKVSGNLRTEQARYVGAIGVVPALIELSTHRRTADVGIALEYGNL